MAIKVILDPLLGRVEYRHRPQRHIRISLKPNVVRVSLPQRIGFEEGERFLNDKRDWVLRHSYGDDEFVSGMGIGRQHQLVVRPGVSGVDQEGLTLYTSDHPPTARRAIVGVLRQEAQEFLLPRLYELAGEMGIEQTISGKLRHMESRWGSCHQAKAQVCLNTLLVQLPEPISDYVIIHELCHLKEANHSPRFWTLVAKHCPDYKERRQALSSYRPVIINRFTQETGRVAVDDQ